jgi:hypothetical protein
MARQWRSLTASQRDKCRRGALSKKNLLHFLYIKQKSSYGDPLLDEKRSQRADRKRPHPPRMGEPKG